MVEITAEAGEKELESRGDTRPECTALNDSVKITIMLRLLYKIKIEQGLKNKLSQNVIAN